MGLKEILLNIIRKAQIKKERNFHDTMMRPPFENKMQEHNRYNHHRR